LLRLVVELATAIKTPNGIQPSRAVAVVVVVEY
jgi:hypothetical protein